MIEKWGGGGKREGVWHFYLSTRREPANVNELLFLLLLLFLADFATSGIACHSRLNARSTSVCGTSG